MNETTANANNTTADFSVTVTQKQVYGNTMYYPKCENALVFASLVGKKTLSAGDLRKIKSLGFTVSIEFTTIDI